MELHWTNTGTHETMKQAELDRNESDDETHENADTLNLRSRHFGF